MIRKIFWLVVLANLGFFVVMRWGEPMLRSESGAQMPQPLNADKIKLLGFTAARPASAPAATPPSQQGSAPQAAPTMASAPPLPAVQAECLEWGEFSGSDLSQASADLAGLKLGDKLTQREVEHAIGYWVYIPPQKTRADVNTKIAHLKKRGVDEYFVVQEKGKWQNTISLGVFKAEDVAHRFLASLKSKGVKGAVMGERQTRLKFTVFVLKNPDGDTLAKLAEWQRDFTDIGMRASPCR